MCYFIIIFYLGCREYEPASKDAEVAKKHLQPSGLALQDCQVLCYEEKFPLVRISVLEYGTQNCKFYQFFYPASTISPF